MDHHAVLVMTNFIFDKDAFKFKEVDPIRKTSKCIYHAILKLKHKL